MSRKPVELPVVRSVAEYIKKKSKFDVEKLTDEEMYQLFYLTDESARGEAHVAREAAEEKEEQLPHDANGKLLVDTRIPKRDTKAIVELLKGYAHLRHDPEFVEKVVNMAKDEPPSTEMYPPENLVIAAGILVTCDL